LASNAASVIYWFRKELIEALLRKGWQVFVSAADDGFGPELTRLGAEFINSPVDRRGANPARDLRLLWFYRRLLRAVKPEAVLTYTIKPNIYLNLAALGLKLPVISTVTGLGDSFINDVFYKKIVFFLYRLAFASKRTAVVFQNREDRGIMLARKLVREGQSMVLPGSGVNIGAFPPKPYPAGDEVVFLYAGRLMFNKGIRELLAAARRLKEEGRPAKVRLIGYYDDDLKEEVEEAQKQGWIEYCGFQREVGPYMAASHCVVLPSYKEGMSNTLLEAAASGRPLIACDVSGCREIIDDGQNGFLCRPKDADSLRAAMCAFMALSQERRAEMGRKSREKAEKEFDRALVTAKITAEIERQLAAAQPERLS